MNIERSVGRPWLPFARGLAALALFGCAGAPSSDVELEARVRALEAEVSRLKNEAADQRAEQMGPGAMSDEQFARYLARTLAKEKPSERERLERMLRANRTLERLGEDGLPGYLEERFAREPKDGAWAGAALRVLLPRVREALEELGPKATLGGFECKSELCRIEVEGDALAEPGGPVMNATSRIMPEDEGYGLFSSVQRGLHQEMPGGRVRVVLFIARQGVEMVR
jgi:hypothetical protein